MTTRKLPKFHFSLIALAAGCALALAGFAPVYSGDAVSESQQRLLTDIKYLASDELEGRGVGLKGLDLAADFIRAQFGAAGLNVSGINGGPFQPFSMTTGSTLLQPNALEIVGPNGVKISLTLESDFQPQTFGGSGAFSGELAFCGYGIDAEDKSFNEFEGIDLNGKVAIIMRRVPRQGNPHGEFTGQRGGVSSHGELRAKVSNAFGKGAAAILFVNDPYSGRSDLERSRKQLSKQAEELAAAAEEFDGAPAEDAEKVAAARKKLAAEVEKYKKAKQRVAAGEPDALMSFGYGGHESIRTIPVLHITRAACDRILKGALNKSLVDLEAAIDKDLKPQSAVLTGWTAGGVVTMERKQAEVKNVIGYLEGEGPLADETIVIGAHYDHVGRGGSGSLAPGSNEIHNGADDNASGTVTLIELARRLAGRKEKLPRRLVFIAFTAEESGLIGSARYTKEPLFPLEKTVAMLNMDMVGRLKDEKLTVFGTGTSPIWEAMVQNLAKAGGFELTMKPEGFGPSDHSSFYAKQIPVLHFFTGNHSDYHRPGDDWEKINVPGMQRVADMLEKIVIDVAKNPERPKYVAVKGTANVMRDGGARPYLGSIPDFGTDSPGYALSGVAPDSPAEKAGLKGGDRIVQFGMQKVESLEDFDAALRRYGPGDTVEVTVMRNGERIKLKVTLDRPRG
jgi:acetylornithine deacetylase/succinyl-diaminopimelate desuccinylase-like protein